SAFSTLVRSMTLQRSQSNSVPNSNDTSPVMIPMEEWPTLPWLEMSACGWQRASGSFRLMLTKCCRSYRQNGSGGRPIITKARLFESVFDQKVLSGSRFVCFEDSRYINFATECMS